MRLSRANRSRSAGRSFYASSLFSPLSRWLAGAWLFIALSRCSCVSAWPQACGAMSGLVHIRATLRTCVATISRGSTAQPRSTRLSTDLLAFVTGATCAGSQPQASATGTTWNGGRSTYGLWLTKQPSQLRQPASRLRACLPVPAGRSSSVGGLFTKETAEPFAYARAASLLAS